MRKCCHVTQPLYLSTLSAVAVHPAQTAMAGKKTARVSGTLAGTLWFLHEKIRQTGHLVALRISR